MTRVRDSTVTLAVGPHEPPELAHEGDAKAGARRALAYGRGPGGLVDRPLDVDRGHSPATAPIGDSSNVPSPADAPKGARSDA